MPYKWELNRAMPHYLSSLNKLKLVVTSFETVSCHLLLQMARMEMD